MNGKQKKVLIIVAFVILGMLLYPPFHQIFKAGQVIGLGYGWIFEAPSYATIDIGVLITQWIGVLIVGAIAFFMLKD